MSDLRVANRGRWLAAPEALVEDARLALDTRLVAVWLAAKPDSWEVRIGPLCGRLGLGRDRWRRIAKELEANGFLRRERVQHPAGTWGWQFVFSSAGDLAGSDGGPLSPPPGGNEAQGSRYAPKKPRKPKSASTVRALSTAEEAAIELEIEAANLAAARGERKAVSYPTKYRSKLAGQILAGTFAPSAPALALAAARKAEAARQARLADPSPRPAKTTPPAAALAKCRAAVGLPA